MQGGWRGRLRGVCGEGCGRQKDNAESGLIARILRENDEFDSVIRDGSRLTQKRKH